MTRRLLHSIARGLFGLCLLLLAACATSQRKPAADLAVSGQASLQAVGRYYDEVALAIPRQLRENLLREALEIEQGPCRHEPRGEACSAGRGAMRGKYREKREATLAWEQALRSRHALVAQAEQLYAAYGALAGDDFSAAVSERSGSLRTTLEGVMATPLPGAAIDSAVGWLAVQLENRQLAQGEAFLEALATAIRAQFVAESDTWATVYDSHAEDFAVNTSWLFDGDYASAADLGAAVLSARKLKAGKSSLAEAGAVRASLVAYAAEDAVAQAIAARSAADAASRALDALVLAHAAYPESGTPVQRALEAARRADEWVDEIQAYRQSRDETESEGGE